MSSSSQSKIMNDTSAYSKGQTQINTDTSDFDIWGDENCESHSLRVGFINIQTFPANLQHHKNNNIRNLIHDYKLSILGLAEINLYWPALTHDQQMVERTRSWFERVSTYTACNKENTKMREQRGGTAIIARGQICSSSYGYRADHLGRWTMITFRGKDGVNYHAISAYRPQRNANPYGVYQQLVQYNVDNNKNTEPIQAYDDDLCQLIQPLVTRGDHVTLMIDANEDLSKNHPTSFKKKMENVGLFETILQQHHKQQPPATRTPGVKPLTPSFVHSQ